MWAVIAATLLAILLLGLVTFVQLLYLESMRLRTRDLPSLKFFKDELEDKLGLKTEEGAGSFSLIKHSMHKIFQMGASGTKRSTKTLLRAIQHRPKLEMFGSRGCG